MLKIFLLFFIIVFIDSTHIRHIHLNFEVDFENKILFGHSVLTVSREKNDKTLVLDTKDLKIDAIKVEPKNNLKYSLDPRNESFGQKLHVTLPQTPTNELNITIVYSTSKNSSGLQWLSPDHTAGKKFPFLFSQCQSIHCRSILPCQDVPAVKTTYTAEILVPSEFTVLMSAIEEREPQKLANNKTIYKFTQKLPIPSYLFAIAVGKLESRPISMISRVWAEPETIATAEYEFGEIPDFLNNASEIVGKYEWGVYDLLVLPPSFPFGGMENPCITFVTPTLLAGDRSLANVVVHEIAHSWTGNLVTNSDFEHFWLNEGFTTFLERKITGKMYGEKMRHFQALEGLDDLRETINHLGANSTLTALVPKLNNMNPDDAYSTVPYEKGHTFLYYIETLIGADKMNQFLRAYIDHFKFKSIKTEDFKNYFIKYFHENESIKKIDWESWLHHPGMPPVIPKYDMTLKNECIHLAKKWIDWHNPGRRMATPGFQSNDLTRFTPPQVRAFLVILMENLSSMSHKKLKYMNDIYRMDDYTNCEIRFKWIQLGVRSKWKSHIQKAFDFVNSNGRMKYIRPVYRDLYDWDESRHTTIENFQKHKHLYMHVLQSQLEKDLHLEGKPASGE